MLTSRRPTGAVPKLAAYRLAVLRASQDVEDAFSSLVQQEARVQALGEGETALARARDASLAAYKGGMVSLVEVLDADRRLLEARDGLVQARAAAARGAIASFRALGGAGMPGQAVRYWPRPMARALRPGRESDARPQPKPNRMEPPNSARSTPRRGRLGRIAPSCALPRRQASANSGAATAKAPPITKAGVGFHPRSGVKAQHAGRIRHAGKQGPDRGPGRREGRWRGFMPGPPHQRR
jgi:hypothetical protein